MAVSWEGGYANVEIYVAELLAAVDFVEILLKLPQSKCQNVSFWSYLSFGDQALPDLYAKPALQNTR